MQAFLRNIAQAEPKTRQLEEEAFYHGAHGLDPAPTLEEIEARSRQELSEQKEEPLRALRALEAKREHARKARPEAEAYWQRIRKELGETPPPYFHALIMGFFAASALLLDAVFVAPTMDTLGIADPGLQYAAASGIAALSTAIFEMAGRLYHNASTALHKRSAIVTAFMAALALVLWGLLRGREIQFAAVLAGNPLGAFLAGHPFLASAFFIFITLATPIVGAVALQHGWQELSEARTWRRARNSFETFRAAEIELAREVQAAADHLTEIETRNAEACRESKAIYKSFYARGERNGARQDTKASVVRKAALGALCALPVALLIPFVFFPAQIGIVLIAGLACFIYFSHCRLHPTHARFLKSENTHFAVTPDEPEPRELDHPAPRRLTKGDPK